MEYASKGVAGSGLGLGIAGTALGLLNANGGGLLGGLFGGNCGTVCSENMPVNRYELQQQKELTNKDMEIAYLRGRDAAKTDSRELYTYVDGKFATVNDKLCAQAVHNATSDSVLGCMQGQIAQLYSLTKLVVPNTSVCPGWGTVTITPAAAPTTTTGG